MSNDTRSGCYCLCNKQEQQRINEQASCLFQRKGDKGILTALDHHIVARQRRLLLKEVGSKVLHADIWTLTAPMELCEAQSFLQKLCSAFAFAPTYLGAAAASTDSLERFTCSIAFVISGLHLLPTTSKPLTPLLGETFEATLCDGAHISCEQVSQQPSVSAWLLQGPQDSYVYYGYSTPKVMGSIGNSFQCGQSGTNCIEFANPKSCIRFTQPTLRIGGILWGERTFSYEGSAVFRDELNRLSCEIVFGGKPHDPGSRAKHFADSIYGVVQRTSRCNTTTKAETLAVIHGCWMAQMNVDNKTLWDARVNMPHATLLPNMAPLQSDSRIRGDLVALASGDLDKSRREKHNLEISQERDECMRKKVATGKLRKAG